MLTNNAAGLDLLEIFCYKFPEVPALKNRIHFMAASQRSLMCPAEENANYGRLRPINARRSSEKTDTRTSKLRAVYGQEVFLW